MSTKETFGLVLGATLVLLLVVPPLVPRRVVLLVLGTAVGVYAAVTVAVWSTSGFAPWWEAHTNGLSRLIGTRQTTGFNAATLTYGDLVADGVIDPVKVTRSAVVNAASVARMILTTESTVVDKPVEDEGDEGHGHGHSH